MKIKYEAPYGKRVKKGSTKIVGGRVCNFYGLCIAGVDYWFDRTDNKWRLLDDMPMGHSFSDSYRGIRSVKAAIRHIKKHTEVPKGMTFVLESNFIGNDIYITK